MEEASESGREIVRRRRRLSKGGSGSVGGGE